MKLHFRKIGEGKPLIILHGLFGSSDNWQTIAKKFSENKFSVFLVDLRNHGHSPHSDEFNYKAMSEDVLELINDKQLFSPVHSTSIAPFIIGHSMGGKTAMQLTLDYPEKASKLIVIDIAPKKYPLQNDEIADALLSLELSKIKTRKEAENTLSEKIPDSATLQLLLKGLYWNDKNQLDWRFNLKTIHSKIENMSEAVNGNRTFEKPTLFIRGEHSDYILSSDEPVIKKYFPNSEIKTAPGAGHWVNADSPQWLVQTCLEFLNII